MGLNATIGFGEHVDPCAARSAPESDVLTSIERRELLRRHLARSSLTGLWADERESLSDAKPSLAHAQTQSLNPKRGINLANRLADRGVGIAMMFGGRRTGAQHALRLLQVKPGFAEFFVGL
jgi:hypothetical protein